jgi:methionine-rich copper-binding protein CopC
VPLRNNAIRFNCGRARNAAIVLLVVGLMLLTPTVALAHAYLDHADPAPGSTLVQAPAQLRLTFSEDVDPTFSQIRVLNAQRAGVDRGDSRIAPDDPHALMVSLQDGLPDGVYSVAWRTLSADDGHSVSGAYTLTVGAAASSTLASQQLRLTRSFRPRRRLPAGGCTSRRASSSARCSPGKPCSARSYPTPRASLAGLRLARQDVWRSSARSPW